MWYPQNQDLMVNGQILSYLIGGKTLTIGCYDPLYVFIQIFNS